MRVLLLTQIIPYPPDAGPKVKTWHVLRYLADCGHEITLLSFVRPEEEAYVDHLRQICHQVHTVPIRRSRLHDVGYWLRSHITGRPFLIERDDLPQMRSYIRQLLAAEKFDVIHADQLTMTQFALGAEGEKRPFLIFDAHNAVWTITERMGESAPWFLKPVLRLESQRIKRYEGMLVEQFDHTMVVIEPDRRALLAGVRDGSTESLRHRITVIPIAVDTRQLYPIHRQPPSARIVTLGTLHYPPNADGIRWFLREVLPLVRQQIPDATLTIIGKNPPKDFLEAAGQYPEVVTVTGYVPDLKPYMEQSSIMVVPVRAGGGMRVRILEAFARAMPVVTTTVGLEGIEATDGKEVLVADDPAAYAAATVQLLRNEELQNRLSANGRLLATTIYDWQIVLKKMDQIYAQATEQTLQ
ncbi:MAG: glycosyltransferase [Anaerolineaceae bacterium]|nr:glycosyltransferase [Anaerolineaceae bacterium]